MKIFEAFKIAMKSLTANKLRSSLTMLGIIIGVGSVITLMSVGQGAQASVTSTLNDMGTNLVYVTSQTPGLKGLASMQTAAFSFNMSDADAVAKVPSVVSAVPIIESYVEVALGDKSVAAVCEATTPGFERTLNYPIDYGQFITERDLAARATTVVIGTKVVEDVFGSGVNPIGQRVKINGRQFTIGGVLVKKGGQMMGVSMDAIVIMPITTFQTRLYPGRTVRGEDAIQELAVQVTDTTVTDQVKQDITDLMRRRHRIVNEKDDFLIMTQEQMLDTFKQITGIFTVVLGAIASISLLVGSIGIMNIMLVSVTERTREIGIRKAVGATRRNILMQFLLESAVLSLSGGAIGIIGGWVVSWLITTFSGAAGFQITCVVTANVVILAITVSVFIGLVSGIYPAMRAARLNPIDALHYE